MSRATGELSMNLLIHDAVRRDLARLDHALESGPTQGRAIDLLRAFRFLRGELTRHHEGEDDHVWPMMTRLGVDPALMSQMEMEHELMADALGGVEAALVALAGGPTPDRLATAREEVSTLVEVVEQHLRHEEDLVEPLLSTMRDSEDWQAVERTLRIDSWVEAGRFFAWLTDDMPTEQRAFLATLFPRPVTTLLARVPGRRYTREITPVWS